MRRYSRAFSSPLAVLLVLQSPRFAFRSSYLPSSFRALRLLFFSLSLSPRILRSARRPGSVLTRHRLTRKQDLTYRARAISPSFLFCLVHHLVRENDGGLSHLREAALGNFKMSLIGRHPLWLRANITMIGVTSVGPGERKPFSSI